MYLHISDTRAALKAGHVIDTDSHGRIIVDKYIGSGGFSLMYLAHVQGSSRFLALKELFPRQVDNALVQRRPDGRISITNPLSGTADAEDAGLWQELQQHFVREAELTRRASAMYSQDGRQIQQNNPDILHVEGPFSDTKGNTYLAIDTYQGESFRDYIERGFLRDDDGCVVANQFIDEIIGILMETAIRLSALHGNGLLHLDLSPDNIYIVPSAGKTRLMPYIIDYGSAYDRSDPAEKTAHRYTHNPFSAPEVLALAELQNLACGYETDESSDTYALASVLFYAATGQLFTSELRLGSTKWKEQIRREYSAGLPSHQGADSFASGLIAFLEQGLAAGPQNRFRTAKQIHHALNSLKTRYREYGNLLPLVGRDELMSYMVLEKYPLYQYKGADGQIHVLCLGSGIFVKRMILSLISCGQMSGSHLHIHVVSDEPEELLKTYLRTTAPALEQYSNLAGSVDTEYVTFSYDQVSDVLDEAVCQRVLDRYPDAHYILVSLGKNSTNTRAVDLYARTLARRKDPKQHRTIINYYRCEDAANNDHVLTNEAELPKWLEVDAFGDNISSYSKIIRSLGLRTLKLAHLYNKLEDPHISLAESAKKLAARQYDQRSSCAAALHLKYKLASVGINPAPSTNTRTIISAYLKALSGNGIGKLLELEHRRWMMYMIADGYRTPAPEELEQFGFEMVDGEFNPSWKCRQKHLHPCLVPCGTAGIVLKTADWKAYASAREIAASPFDPLDRISLTLHALARKKCRRILEDETIDDYFQRISSRLQYAQLEADENTQSAHAYDPLRTMLKKAQETICTAAQTLHYTGDNGLLAELQRSFESFDINISGEISGLRHCLSVFAEYASYKDYKAPDATIIRNLLWLLYADNEITFIKLSGRTIADNMTGPLILEPHRLVFFGEEPHPEWDSFLRRHGNRGEIAYCHYCGHTVTEICTALKQIMSRRHTKYVIDVTGASEQMVIAAQRAADANSQISLIRCTPDGAVENIQRFVTAPAYTLNTTIAANEIFSLHGAQELPSSSRYMEQLEDLVPALWAFFREFRKDWNMVTAFFSSRAAGSSELWIRNIRIEPDTVWKPYSRKIDKAKWNMLELDRVFRKLEDAGIIQDFSRDEDIPGRLCLDFLYPTSSENGTSDFFRKALDLFFSQKILPVFVPMQCDIKHSPLTGFTVDIRSGCQVDVFDKRSIEFTDKRSQAQGGRGQYPYSKIVPALKRLEELRLIADLEISSPLDMTPVSIRFIYTNPAVKDCLTVAGNALELYIWREARRTHFFDNVQANFSFAWKEGISNELDVVLTRGLTSLIVSAKTSRFNKEHLYEIKYLTERFSLNSKPVIVYSSDQAFEDGHTTDNLLPVKNRAKAMGIYLIDLNELEGTLGDKLVSIAAGTAAL